jgi:hypothetical protein
MRRALELCGDPLLTGGRLVRRDHVRSLGAAGAGHEPGAVRAVIESATAGPEFPNFRSPDVRR